MSRAVAALGDSALLLPAAALLLAFLLVTHRGGLALAWAVALATAGAATVAAKLLFHACGPTLTDLDVISPSGHTSFALVFYGGLAVMLAAGRERSVRWGLGLACAALTLAIGASRVRTGAHSIEEVAIGLGLGAAGVIVFAWLHRRAGRPPLPWPPVAAGFALAVLLVGGAHFSLEGRIERTARRLADALDVCAPSDAASQRSMFRLGR